MESQTPVSPMIIGTTMSPVEPQISQADKRPGLPTEALVLT